MAWVFAYGSLMGDAVLGRYRARPARLPGYRRAFLHESRRRWGTPESPCPILGLAPGGECWGLVFEIPDAERRAVQSALEKREAAEERRRETRTTETPEGPVDAWVWVSRPSNGSERDRPGDGRGAPSRRARRRGNGRRVRADARPRDGAARHPRPPRRDALEAAAGLSAPCSSTSPPRTSSAAARRSGAGRARCTPSPRRVAGLFDLGLRHHVRPAAMKWWTDGALEAVPDWRLDRLAIRLALFGRERLGLEPGERVAVLGRLGWLWPVVDFAAMGFGVLPVGLEHDLPRRRRRLRLRRGRAAGGLRDRRRERGAAGAAPADGPSRGRDRRGRGADRGGGPPAPSPRCWTWPPSSTPPSGPRPSARSRARSAPRAPPCGTPGRGASSA